MIAGFQCTCLDCILKSSTLAPFLYIATSSCTFRLMTYIRTKLDYVRYNSSVTSRVLASNSREAREYLKFNTRVPRIQHARVPWVLVSSVIFWSYQSYSRYFRKPKQNTLLIGDIKHVINTWAYPLRARISCLIGRLAI